jgi:hypothetical protein
MFLEAKIQEILMIRKGILYQAENKELKERNKTSIHRASEKDNLTALEQLVKASWKRKASFMMEWFPPS